jgi:hypothetical protein
MDLEEEVKKVLLEMAKTIKIHQIDGENSVIEIDYDKYTKEILRTFRDYLVE